MEKKDFLTHILEDQKILDIGLKQSRLHKAERTGKLVKTTDKRPPDHQEKNSEKSSEAWLIFVYDI